MNFQVSLLYIDPGTGSMLFSLVVGIAAALTFGVRALAVKLKFIMSGGKAEKTAGETSLPFVIFSDHKRYWPMFKPLCDEAERRELPFVYYTASPDDPALSEPYRYVKCKFIGEGNKPFVTLNFLNADVLVSTTPGLDVYQWKRSPDVAYYVHVPHSVDELAGYRMFGLDYYDAVLTSGKCQNDFIRTIESLRPGIAKKELLTVGSLPLDVLKAKYDANTSREKNAKTVVLVAPSWGPSALLSKYGAKLLEALAQTDFEIIVRPHPQTLVSEQAVLKPLTEKFSEFEWNYDNDNFAVLDKADILITDFSGIIFDYALVFGKPVIYSINDFDTAVYDADWLDKPKWSIQILPALGIELNSAEFGKIGEVINEAISSDVLKSGREKILAECWSNVGNSASCIVDYLVQKQKIVSTK